MTGFVAQDARMTDTTTRPTAAPTSPDDLTVVPLATGDPRLLFARAVATGTAVISAVPPGAMGDPTPCESFDVRRLLGHLVGVLDRVARLGRGEDPFAVGDAEAGDGEWVEAWAEAAHGVQRAWTDDAVLARPMALPWQQGTGADILTGYLNELTVHTWDLATATGQEPAWDEEVLNVVLSLPIGLPAEGRRAVFERISAEMGLPEVALPFADAVPVADDAPAIERVVAWNGRPPTWRRPAPGSAPSDPDGGRR
jgi:uncharacterized protein (TIGR03086 family)